MSQVSSERCFKCSPLIAVLGTLLASVVVMPRPLRMFEQDKIYFVTSRTFQGRFLMVPSREIKQLIGALLAKAAKLYDIKLYGYVFMSNHFHLLIRGTPRAIPRFVGWLKKSISTRVGRIVGWRGSFWGRRYDAAPVLDDEALDEKLAYIASHGVKEGLVEDTSEWPGLHCADHLVSEDDPSFPSADGEFVLRLERLPSWQNLPKRAYQQRTATWLAEVVDAARSRLIELKPLGVEHVLRQGPEERAPNVKSPPRPLCHARSSAIRKAFVETYRAFSAAYAEASKRYREGNFSVRFPGNAFRPSVPPNEQKEAKFQGADESDTERVPKDSLPADEGSRTD